MQKKQIFSFFIILFLTNIIYSDCEMTIFKTSNSIIVNVDSIDHLNLSNMNLFRLTFNEEIKIEEKLIHNNSNIFSNLSDGVYFLQYKNCKSELIEIYNLKAYIIETQFEMGIFIINRKDATPIKNATIYSFFDKKCNEIWDSDFLILEGKTDENGFLKINRKPQSILIRKEDKMVCKNIEQKNLEQKELGTIFFLNKLNYNRNDILKSNIFVYQKETNKLIEGRYTIKIINSEDKIIYNERQICLFGNCEVNFKINNEFKKGEFKICIERNNEENCKIFYVEEELEYNLENNLDFSIFYENQKINIELKNQTAFLFLVYENDMKNFIVYNKTEYDLILENITGHVYLFIHYPKINENIKKEFFIFKENDQEIQIDIIDDKIYLENKNKELKIKVISIISDKNLKIQDLIEKNDVFFSKEIEGENSNYSIFFYEHFDLDEKKIINIKKYTEQEQFLNLFIYDHDFNFIKKTIKLPNDYHSFVNINEKIICKYDIDKISFNLTLKKIGNYFIKIETDDNFIQPREFQIINDMENKTYMIEKEVFTINENINAKITITYENKTQEKTFDIKSINCKNIKTSYEIVAKTTNYLTSRTYFSEKEDIENGVVFSNTLSGLALFLKNPKFCDIQSFIYEKIIPLNIENELRKNNLLMSSKVDVKNEINRLKIIQNQDGGFGKTCLNESDKYTSGLVFYFLNSAKLMNNQVDEELFLKNKQYIENILLNEEVNYEVCYLSYIYFLANQNKTINEKIIERIKNNQINICQIVYLNMINDSKKAKELIECNNEICKLKEKSFSYEYGMLINLFTENKEFEKSSKLLFYLLREKKQVQNALLFSSNFMFYEIMEKNKTNLQVFFRENMIFAGELLNSNYIQINFRKNEIHHLIKMMTGREQEIYYAIYSKKNVESNENFLNYCIGIEGDLCANQGYAYLNSLNCKHNYYYDETDREFKYFLNDIKKENCYFTQNQTHYMLNSDNMDYSIFVKYKNMQTQEINQKNIIKNIAGNTIEGIFYICRNESHILFNRKNIDMNLYNLNEKISTYSFYPNEFSKKISYETIEEIEKKEQININEAIIFSLFILLIPFLIMIYIKRKKTNKNQ